MKQRNFLECFMVSIKILSFRFQTSPNYTEVGLEYATNFESHQVQKYLTSNQNILMKS
jgi:hypothetical protein